MNKLAIIIPYYKINYFEDTLKSLAAQSNKNFALYIGNDASPDDPLQLINKYLEKNNYQYFAYADNVGGEYLVQQWERILKNVEEEWFQILGDDDMISENFVEEFYNHLTEIMENNCKVLKFSQRRIDAEGNPLSRYTEYPTLMTPFENWAKKHIDRDMSSLSEHVFNIVAYRKVGFRNIPLAWGADDLAVLEIASNNPIYFISKAKVLVRISTENISGSDTNLSKKMQADHMVRNYLLNRYFSRLPNAYISTAIEKEIRYAFDYGKEKLVISPFALFIKIYEFKKALKYLKQRRYIKNKS